MNNKKGFTLVELMITLVIVGIIVSAAVATFMTISKTSTVQSKVAEVQVEDLLGIDILRYDIEMAGYGLPNVPPSDIVDFPVASPYPLQDQTGTNLVNYLEAVDNTFYAAVEANFVPNKFDASADTFNDTPNVPRPVVVGDNVTLGEDPIDTYDDSDVLVIKSQTAALSDISKKWTIRYCQTPPCPGTNAFENKAWSPAATPDLSYEFLDNDVIIAISSNHHVIQTSGGAWSYTLQDWCDSAVGTCSDPLDGGNLSAIPDPASDDKFNILYGLVSNSGTVRMPFQRADYYLQRPCTVADDADGLCTKTATSIYEFPDKCHPQSYSLYRATIVQSTTDDDCDFSVTANQHGGCRREQSIVDCVLDFQVALGITTGANGNIVDKWVDNWAATGLPDDAEQIYSNLKEIRIFILTHEGEYDKDYLYSEPNNCSNPDSACTFPIGVDLNGDGDYTDTSVNGIPGLDELSLKTYDIRKLTNFKNYRYKLHTISVKTVNLGG
ncbi:type IV pilus assembly protein PilW [Candidatus Magnetoovum chiemensis]|nr:type IV pilus assembly protein PilW [Candidatus Magnetoovum chiemensis]